MSGGPAFVAGVREALRQSETASAYERILESAVRSGVPLDLGRLLAWEVPVDLYQLGVPLDDAPVLIDRLAAGAAPALRTWIAQSARGTLDRVRNGLPVVGTGVRGGFKTTFGGIGDYSDLRRLPPAQRRAAARERVMTALHFSHLRGVLNRLDREAEAPVAPLPRVRLSIRALCEVAGISPGSARAALKALEGDGHVRQGADGAWELLSDTGRLAAVRAAELIPWRPPLPAEEAARLERMRAQSGKARKARKGWLRSQPRK